MAFQGLESVGLIEIGAIATFGILLFSIYRYKAGNLETAREREDRLRTLEGKSLKKGKFVITIDNVELDKKSGAFYRVKRWMLRPVDGTIYITIRLHHIGVPEGLWEMDHAEAFYDIFEFPVECVNSTLTSKHTALVFKLETAEYLDMKQFLDDFTNFFKALEDSGTASVVNSNSMSFKF